MTQKSEEVVKQTCDRIQIIIYLYLLLMVEHITKSHYSIDTVILLSFLKQVKKEDPKNQNNYL
jgi:hypothetical protein